MSGVLVDRAALETALSTLLRPSQHVCKDGTRLLYRACQVCDGVEWEDSTHSHDPECAVLTLRAALTIPAPAGAVAGERWLPFWELYEVPRLSGGVLSIGHDIDPDRPMDALSTTVIRHEFRGRVREVEVTHGENPYERLRAAEWRERDIPADDLLEALKTPMPGRTP